jgi:hypothetical protein
MQGYFSLVLHAHLPFVRHPEHKKFLEECWLFEAITETYVPLLQILDGWWRDGMTAPLTLSLSPPLCAMLLDPLLCARYEQHLDSLIELAEKEIQRTGTARSANSLGCRITVSPSSAKRGGDPAAISSPRSSNFRTKAALKSSRRRPRMDCCRCSPAIRRPSARKF